MIVIAALILDTERRALMSLRALNRQCPGMWEYPGGKVEHGEDPVIALAREVQEELAITVRPVAAVTKFDLDFGRPFAFWLYHCAIVSGVPRANEDQQAVNYFHVDDAVKRLACCPSTYISYSPVMSYIAALTEVSL